MIVIEHEDGRIFVDCKNVISSREMIKFTVRPENILDSEGRPTYPGSRPTEFCLNFMVVKDIRSERVKPPAHVYPVDADPLGVREYIGYGLLIAVVVCIVVAIVTAYTLVTA